MKTQQAQWFAVDWGTSNLRIWAMDADDQVISKVTSERGMASLAQAEFEPTLVDLIAPFLGDGTTPVICCGMVGARQGWAEAEYLSTPCEPPNTAAALLVPTKDARLKVHILPGVMQASPADVMRGEETQIAGFLAQHPKFDGTICLPGTHTKWVQISAGEIVSFRTFMTGELFSLLHDKSVLRFGLSGNEWSDAAFADAVDDALGSPQHFASRLFGLRAEGLLNDLSAADARARLSGLLIGLELAGARGYWLGQDIAIVGDQDLNVLYAAALEKQGVGCMSADGGELTLAGLTAARRVLSKDI